MPQLDDDLQTDELTSSISVDQLFNEGAGLEWLDEMEGRLRYEDTDV